MKLLQYDRARQALQEAHSLDEVKEIADKAKAMASYARQANDPEMEAWVADIRFRAYERLGKLSLELDGGKGGRPTRNRSTTGTVSRRAAWKQAKISVATGGRAVKLAKAGKKVTAYLKRKAVKKKPPSVTEFLGDLKREEKVEKIITKAAALPELSDCETLYPVIYADPPWRYEYSKAKSRAIENQYPTMSLDGIQALEPPADDDAILFLWATSPKLAEALTVMEAWGFEYRTCMVWVKRKIGMGYYARQQHELLLIGSRGSFPTPEPSNRPASVVEARQGKHSVKPSLFYEIIEAMYPEFDGLRIELFQRKPRKGWHGWGFEA
jgi:N6-adenosine-specific RNA methylase IME4